MTNDYTRPRVYIYDLETSAMQPTSPVSFESITINNINVKT